MSEHSMVELTETVTYPVREADGWYWTSSGERRELCGDCGGWISTIIPRKRLWKWAS